VDGSPVENRCRDHRYCFKKQWRYESYLLVYFHSVYGEWDFEGFGGMFM